MGHFGQPGYEGKSLLQYCWLEELTPIKVTSSLVFKRNFPPFFDPRWFLLSYSSFSPRMDTQTDNDLKHQLSWVAIPMEDVCPDMINKWLSAFAKSNGTTSEMMLCSALASTSALIGPTTIKLFGSYIIFMVVVAPPVTGKTPAYQKACMEPIVKELENKIETNVAIDETSTLVYSIITN